MSDYQYQLQKFKLTQTEKTLLREIRAHQIETKESEKYENIHRQ